MNISTDTLTVDSLTPQGAENVGDASPPRNPHEWCCCGCAHVRKGSRVGLVILTLLVCLDLFRVCMDILAGGSHVHFGIEFSIAVFYLLLCVAALTGVSKCRAAYLVPWMITSLLLFLGLCGISLILVMHWQIWFRLLELNSEDVIVIGAVLVILWATLTLFLYLIWVVFRCYRYLKQLPALATADTLVRRATLKNGLVVQAPPGEVLDLRSLMPYIAQIHEPALHLSRRKYSSLDLLEESMSDHRSHRKCSSINLLDHPMIDHRRKYSSIMPPDQYQLSLPSVSLDSQRRASWGGRSIGAGSFRMQGINPAAESIDESGKKWKLVDRPRFDPNIVVVGVEEHAEDEVML